MLMELGFQVALVIGHPADEGLWLEVTLSSNVLEWHWQDSDVSRCQVFFPIPTPPPVSLMYNIMHLTW